MLSRPTHSIILEGHSIGAIKINTSISRRFIYNLKESTVFGLYLTKWQKWLSTTEQHIKAPFGLICKQSGLSRQQCHFHVHVQSAACVSDASGSNRHSEHTCKMNLSLDFHYTNGITKLWVTCIQIHVCHVDWIINQEQCSALCSWHAFTSVSWTQMNEPDKQMQLSL